MAAIGDLVANLSLNNSGFRKGAQQSRSILSSLGTAVMGTVASIGALVGGISIAGAVGWGVKLAADAEQSQVAFEVLLGSADKATQMLSDLRKYSDVSPFGSADVNKFAQDLMNYGIAAGDILPTISMLGDVAAGDVNKFDGLARAFGQMSSTGRLMGQDLNQMINAGFNPLQEISAKTGESMAELKKRMEAGGISTAEVSGAFKTATSEGGRFFGMTERQAGTMTGKFSTLKDNVSNSLRTIGESIAKNLDLSGILDRMNSAVSQIPFYFQNAGDLLHIELLGWQVYLDEAYPGFAELAQKIGIVFAATFEATTAAFAKFVADFKAGLSDVGNFAKGIVAGAGGVAGKVKNGIGGVFEGQNGPTTPGEENLTFSDMVSSFFGGASFGAVGDARLNLPGVEEFNAANPAAKDQTKLGDNAAAKFLEVFNAKVADGLKDLNTQAAGAGGLAEALRQQKADLMWKMAGAGDTSGYGSPKTKLGKGAGDQPKPPGTEEKDTATNKAAMKGSSEAASILTRGAFTDIPKQQVELSKQQLTILRQIAAQNKENERAKKFDMNLVLMNF